MIRFLDFSKVNRQKNNDIDDDEEAIDDDQPGDDNGFPIEPPTSRRRLTLDAEDDRLGLDLPGEQSGLHSLSTFFCCLAILVLAWRPSFFAGKLANIPSSLLCQ